MNLNKFDSLYSEANNAKISGDFITAKRCFWLAGRSLLEAALEFEGDIKNALVNRAQIVIKYADTLPNSTSADSSSSPTEPIKQKVESTSSASETIESNDIKFVPAVVPEISFNDVAGLEDVKQAIKRRIINAMQHPELYEKFKVETGGGVLLYGLPGTGKTMIAKAIAHEVNAKFYSIRCSDIVSKWFGEAEKRIKELFTQASNDEIAVIFFDEFDSLAPKRSTKSTVMPRVVNELLSQIDGFSKSKNTLLLLAATNRPWDIDSGILRSKRFSEKIYVPLPDVAARKHILKMNFEDAPMEEGIDFDDVAERINNFNGADVSEFCNRCKDAVLERSIQVKMSGGNYDNEMITKDDINNTLNWFVSSVSSEDIKLINKFTEQFG